MKLAPLLLGTLVALLAPPGPAAARTAPPARTSSSVPVARVRTAPPALEGAASAIVIDAGDGQVLAAKRPDQSRPMASTTKLMTALLALERTRPGEVLTAPPYRALPAESQIGLAAGERMRVADLLEALLLESANDAAATIAQGVAGSRQAFVRAMNRRAAQLHLLHTSYANPIGLDEPGNYSSARDLASLTRVLLRNRRFARVVDMPAAVLHSGAHRRVVDNRNDLVGRYGFVDGVKTGHTIDAGYVLVGAARGLDRAQVVSVVMGEPSESARDADTLALLRYGLAQFRRARVLSPARVVARPHIAYRDERAELVPRTPLVVTVRRGERIERQVSAPDKLDGPIPAGRRVGSVTVRRDGEVVGRVDLVTAQLVPGASTLRIIISELGVPLILILVGILVTSALLVRRLRVRLRLVRSR